MDTSSCLRHLPSDLVVSAQVRWAPSSDSFAFQLGASMLGGVLISKRSVSEVEYNNIVLVIRDRLSSMARPPSRCRTAVLQVSNDHDTCAADGGLLRLLYLFITSVYMERIIMHSIFTCVVVWRPMLHRSSVHIPVLVPYVTACAIWARQNN